MNPSCDSCDSTRLMTEAMTSLFNRRRLVTVTCQVCGHKTIRCERRIDGVWKVAA